MTRHAFVGAWSSCREEGNSLLKTVVGNGPKASRCPRPRDRTATLWAKGVRGLAGSTLGGLVVLTLGCQGGLNLAGTWYGDLYVVYEGQLTGYPRPILVTVNGNSAQLGPFCPDGTGSLTATGSGSVATVSGSLACQAASIGSCPSVALTYTSATADLIVPMAPDDPFLSIAAAGIAAGCELEGPFTANFRGDSS
jgi:hypothetical protein